VGKVMESGFGPNANRVKRKERELVATEIPGAMDVGGGGD